MALAGYCRQCGQHVYLTEQWACVNGHPYTDISAWYDPDTGAPIQPFWLQPAPAPAAEVAPAPVPAPAVAPEPVVEPMAVAAPAPEPVLVVAPEPTPEPAVVAAPEPAVEPVPVAAVAPAPEPAPVAVAPAAPAAASDRLTLLADILAVLGQYPSFNAHYGTDTDVVVDNQIVNANWGTGKKKVEYSAIMKAVEAERTLYFWEIVKESSSGLNFGGFEAESYSTSGATRSGKQKMMIVGANGVPVEWEWDYGATRSVIEDVARRHGWATKVVLQKKAAQW